MSEAKAENTKSKIERTTAEDAHAHAKLRDAIVYPPDGMQVCGQPNCAYFDAKERSMRNYKTRFLYDEYKQACDREGLIALRPSTFRSKLAKWRRDEEARRAPAWYPGELMKTYWAEPLPNMPEPLERFPLFVSYLPYSGLAFLQVCEEESIMDWARSCAEAYRYLGGVPHVTERWRMSDSPNASKGDPRRITLQAFASHYKTVLLHPRPKMGKGHEPSDRVKPLVLKRHTPAAGYVRANFSAEPGMTLDDVNAQVRALVDAYNRAHEGFNPSIWETFQREEAPQLLSLPECDYDMATWTERQVGRDYHVSYNHVRYSVPYQFAGERVRVRAGGDALEVYGAGSLIARHGIPEKIAGKGIVTDPEHRPPAHRGFANRLEERFMALALDFGPATGAVMRELVLECQKAKGCWHPCKDLLDLSRTPSGIKLEDACALALERGLPLTAASVAQVMEEKTW